MAAKDYEIALGMASAYFAKKKKKPSNTMSEDRRPIEEGEIMMLVDFSLKNYCIENDCNGFSFESRQWPGKKVILKIEDINK